MCLHRGFLYSFHLCFYPVLPFFSRKISHTEADDSFPAFS